mmetsp:Transcript_10654/g.20672  ORF Transcript_10654/g.20672 Transcript_10654/m.20672 type:complete len:292 (+) Transcript_10654:29-904(+)
MASRGTQRSLRAVWTVASAVGVRNVGRAARVILRQYRDTLLFFRAADYPGVEGHVALTIDDGICRSGPENSLVAEVRNLLAEHGAKATFFVCSDYLPGYETDARGLLADGHEFGNHMTCDCHKWASGPAQEFQNDLLACNHAIEQLLLPKAPSSMPSGRVRWFRAPGAKLSFAMRAGLERLGLRSALGDCYCDDWAIEDPQFIAKTMLRQVTSGSIVILHMPERGYREHSLEALRLVLEGLRQRGLRCVTLSKLSELAGEDEDSETTGTSDTSGSSDQSSEGCEGVCLLPK